MNHSLRRPLAVGERPLLDAPVGLSHRIVPVWELVVRGWSPPGPPARTAPTAPAPPRRELKPHERLPLPTDLAPATTTLAAALLGDRTSWAQVLLPLHGRLVALAGRRIPGGLVGRLDAEDLVQETYLHVLANNACFEDRGSGSFLGWVVRLLENTVADAVRHQYRHRRNPGREAGTAAALELVDDRETGCSPLERLLLAEERAELAHEVARLTAADRRLLEERYGEGASFARIALARGWSEATARRRVSELVGRLQGALE